MLQKVKGNIFRAPREGMSRSAGLTFGIMQTLVGSFFVLGVIFLDSPIGESSLSAILRLMLGVLLILQGVADLLPADRVRLAGWLRLLSFAACLLALLGFVYLLVAA